MCLEQLNVVLQFYYRYVETCVANGGPDIQILEGRQVV